MYRILQLQDAYTYSFSRTVDWHGPCNYYRNINLTEAFQNDEKDEERKASVGVDVLIIAGNNDPGISLDVISQTAQLVQRSVMFSSLSVSVIHASGAWFTSSTGQDIFLIRSNLCTATESFTSSWKVRRANFQLFSISFKMKRTVRMLLMVLHWRRRRREE